MLRPAQALRLEAPGPAYARVSAGIKIGRASHHFRQMRSQNRDRLSRSDTGCHGAVRRGKSWKVGVPTLGKPPVYDSLELRRQVRVFLGKSLKT